MDADRALLKKLQAQRVVGTNTTTIKKNTVESHEVSKKEFDAKYAVNGGGETKDRVLAANTDVLFPKIIV